MLGILLVVGSIATIASMILLPNGGLLLSGFAVLLALRTRGLLPGLLTAVICGFYTLPFVQTAHLLILLTSEALVVGLMFRSGMKSILVADTLFWAFFGFPLGWLLYGILHGSIGGSAPLELIRLCAGGLLNALIAFILHETLLRKNQNRIYSDGYWETQFNLILGAFLLPSLLVALGNVFEQIAGVKLFGNISISASMSFSLAAMVLPALLALGLIRNSSRNLLLPLRELTDLTCELPETVASGKRIKWPETASSEVNALIKNFYRTATAIEKSLGEIKSARAEARQEADELLAQRNWEFFATGRKLKSELDRRHHVEGILAKLEAAESKYRFLVEKTLVGVYVVQNNRISYSNPKLAEIFGYTVEELMDRCSFLDLVLKEDRVLVADHLRKQELGEANNLQYQFRGVRKDGRHIHVEVINGKGVYNGTMAILGTLLDVSDRIQAQKTIQHLAYHDPLTEIPNRLLFGDRLQQALAYAERNDRIVALLFLDLDRFKTINDTLGHSAGDQLLRKVAARIQDCLRDSDTVGRFGGDEFNILVTQIKKASDAELVAHKIIRAMKFPFDIEGHELFVTCSIGIAVYPYDAEDVQTMMKYADAALYRAKDLGRNNYQVFSPSIPVRSLERMTLETNLRRAMERSEFQLHYQPQVDMQSGRVIGMEALIRWERPTGEIIPPQSFIPLAEEIGIIVPIGEWVLFTACRQSGAWQREGLESLRVGVNVSPLQFQEKNFIEVVSRIVSESGLDPRWINLEITESVMIRGAREAITKFCQLHDVGLTVAIDDFGIGYSSLSYLREFPVDQLKLDRAFVRNLPYDSNDVEIARHIVEMAHGLGLKVIAEGVETLEQYEFLQKLECDEVQGYFIGAPMSRNEFETLLRCGLPLNPGGSSGELKSAPEAS